MKISKLIVSIGACELVGLASTPFTLAAIPTWYVSLHKPIFSPPSWVFGPVWTGLYFLMGISLYLLWSKGIKNKNSKAAVLYFMIQLALNFLWSILFFAGHSPTVAFIDILLLWVAIIITIFKFSSLSKSASYFLIPYFIWVTCAVILNFSIVVLNR